LIHFYKRFKQTSYMDPQRPTRTKDGNWDFPEDISFPVDARVMIKFYKVSESGCESEGGRGQTKFLNTKVMKAEVSFSKEDLFCKASVLEAIERDCEVKKMCDEESIKNPKVELSIKRQDSGEVFSVIKMGFVVKRLEKLKDRTDTILIEAKEQIVSFEPKQPTIRILVNSVPQENAVSGRLLQEKVVSSLKSALKELNNSTYDKETRKIVCGKCFCEFKPRDSGGTKTLVTYFKEHHFKSCGNKEKKRKAEEEAKEEQKLKKKKQVEKMDKYWSALRNKDKINEDEDAFEDPDLNIEDEDVEVVSIPGPSSSISG